MKYQVLFIDFFGVLVKPRHASVLFGGDVDEGFVKEMKPIIQTLASRYKLVIMSASSYDRIARVLEDQGILSCFSDIVSGKDKADGITTILHLYGIPAEQAAFITDTVSDVRASLLAKVTPIAVGWGIERKETLLTSGAEKAAIKPKGLLTLFIPRKRKKKSQLSSIQTPSKPSGSTLFMD